MLYMSALLSVPRLCSSLVMETDYLTAVTLSDLFTVPWVLKTPSKENAIFFYKPLDQ